MIPRIVLAALALAALSPASAQAQVNTSGTLRTGGVYRASPPALSDQQLAPFRLDGAGALVTTATIANLPSVQAISASQLPASLGQKTGAASLPVVLPSDQGAVPVSGTLAATQSGAWNVGLTGTLPAFAATPTFNLGTLNGAATAANQASQIAALGATTDAAGSNSIIGQLKQANVNLLAATPTGTNVIGKVGIDQSTPGTTNRVNIGTDGFVGTYQYGLWGTSVLSSSGGLTSVSRIVSAPASTNATLAKSSAGRLYKITGYNAAASLRWLKLYNKATIPVPGTDTPFFQLPLPPGAFSFDAQDIGYSFGTGIGHAITTGAADNDSTAVTAGDVLNLNVWVQ